MTTPLPPELVTILCNAANAPADVRTLEALVALWLADNAVEPEENAEFPWSAICLFELRSHPDLVWAFVTQALAGATSVWQVVMLAAGPLEDLITDHGPDYIDRIERAARHSSRFAYALTGVWPPADAEGPRDAEVWARIEAARAKAMDTGLDMGGPLPAR